MKSLQALFFVLASSGLTSAATFWGVTDGNNLVSFDSANPGTFLTTTSISGLVASDGVTADPYASIVNLSYNPATGRFTGIDTNANIYQVAQTGDAVLLSNVFAPAGYDAGLAYDSFTGGFMYADDAGDRFNINNAGVASSVGSAYYATGDINELTAPSISGLAIDPDFGTAFFLDASLGIIAQALDPDALELFTLGDLGVSITSYGDLGFDLDGNLYASLSTDGLSSGFYAIDQLNGSASLIGSFGQGVTTITIPEPSSTLLGAFGIMFLLRRRRA
ncbi:DUF4394 domain-containing protein [Haloferula chungangensis]|uniref:DUF4394 domain-containing protein n=1 Tax=Haloferula chungangensis TaxID=1048331 RepID=A0ABW2L4D0_9BACT